MEQVVLEDVLAQIRSALESNDLATASSIIESRQTRLMFLQTWLTITKPNYSTK